MKHVLISPDGKDRFETDSAIIANDYQFGHGWTLVEPSAAPAKPATDAKGTDSK